jgi:cell division septal protein FtsQ
LKDRASKISGLVFFLFLCAGLVYLMLIVSGSNEENSYETIELSGNILLSETEYLRYTGLKNSTSYSSISLVDVKSRLENHPYVIKADVRFDGINKILAELVEKNPKAFVLNKNKFNLITEDCELLPVINENLVASLPIISNLKKLNNKPLDKAQLKAAFKIIDAVKIVDKNMYESLAEINLRNGGDILIMFTGFPFPIVFGKNYEAKKILALKNIWNSMLIEKSSTFTIEYIDLRYKNKIFIGKRKPTQLTG